LIVAVDTSILILLFDEKANGPKDPETGKPVDGCQARVRHLVDTLAKTKGSKIIIPTPSLGEFLVRSTPLAASLYISTLERLRGVRISPFSSERRSNLRNYSVRPYRRESVRSPANCSTVPSQNLIIK